MQTFIAEGSHIEDEEIFYAEPPDLISSLLSFDASELAGLDEKPEDMLVRKASEIKSWRIEGIHPRFLVSQWIEVVVTGQLQGYCRILNSRSHIHLQPFTLDTLINEFGRLIKWIQTYQTPEDFVPWLLAAYDELADSPGSEVAIHDIYKLINSRQPSFRREAFGIDLARTLAGSAFIEGRRVRLGYSGGPLNQRYALCLSRKRAAQITDRISIEATLQSLDI